MKTVKVKRKKKDDEKKDVAGMIIGILFLLIVIAAGYYMFDMFRQREITIENICYDWKVPVQPGENIVEHWQFQPPLDSNSEVGKATHYRMNTDTNTIEGDREEYDYTIVLEEGKTHPVIICVPSNGKQSEKEAGTIRFQVTALSKAQMSAFIGHQANKTTRLTRPIF